jgi:hypothetical protein
MTGRMMKQASKKSSANTPPSQTVMGHRIEGPRMTAAGAWLLAWSVGLPILLLGLTLDLALEWMFGWCVGLWCLV